MHQWKEWFCISHSPRCLWVHEWQHHSRQCGIGTAVGHWRHEVYPFWNTEQQLCRLVKRHSLAPMGQTPGESIGKLQGLQIGCSGLPLACSVISFRAVLLLPTETRFEKILLSCCCIARCPSVVRPYCNSSSMAPDCHFTNLHLDNRVASACSICTWALQ